jgi:DNA-binding IclR family transcriptional regulator
MSESERYVEALMSGLQLLEAFDDDRPLRLKDLHDRTGLNRSRILRLAGTLQAAGFLEQLEGTGAYRLGSKLYSIGRLLQARFSRLPDMVRPSLRRLMQLTGDTAFYSVVQGAERLVVAREESSEGLRFIVHEGQTRPLHAGATSKVLLAFGPPMLRRRVLNGTDFKRLTAATPIDSTRLQSDLEQVARDGFAISRGEATAHGFAVSVPVVQPGQQGSAALTVAGPLAKLTDDLARVYVEHLLGEAKVIASVLAQARDPSSDLPSAAAE